MNGMYEALYGTDEATLGLLQPIHRISRGWRKSCDTPETAPLGVSERIRTALLSYPLVSAEPKLRRDELTLLYHAILLSEGAITTADGVGYNLRDSAGDPRVGSESHTSPIFGPRLPQ